MTQLQKAIEEIGNWRPCSKDILGEPIPVGSIQKCYEAAKEIVGQKLINAALRIEAEKTIESLRSEVVLMAEQSTKQLQVVEKRCDDHESQWHKAEREIDSLREQLQSITQERDELQRRFDNLKRDWGTASDLLGKNSDREKLTLLLQYLSRAEKSEQQLSQLSADFEKVAEALQYVVCHEHDEQKPCSFCDKVYKALSTPSAKMVLNGADGANGTHATQGAKAEDV